MNTKSKRVADFTFGHCIQNTVINAFDYGLNYKTIATGLENRYSLLNKELVVLSKSTDDLETFKNMERMRSEPDALLLSPKLKTIQMEIKSRKIINFDKFLENNFNNNEIRKVYKYHPTTRILYIDLFKRRIASINLSDEITEDAQYNNWYHPWTWIDGISNRSELVKWQEEYIFSPLMIQSEKIISRLGNEIYET